MQATNITTSSADGTAVTTDMVGTRKEALAFINKQPAKTCFYIRIDGFAPIKGEPGKVFPTYTSLKISRRDARKLALDIVGETLEARGALTKLALYESGDYRAVYLG